jgi:hypothetical protein
MPKGPGQRLATPLNRSIADQLFSRLPLPPGAEPEAKRVAGAYAALVLAAHVAMSRLGRPASDSAPPPRARRPALPGSRRSRAHRRRFWPDAIAADWSARRWQPRRPIRDLEPD